MVIRAEMAILDINGTMISRSDKTWWPLGEDISWFVLGPKLLLVMGCVKLGEKNCVQLPSVGEQNN